MKDPLVREIEDLVGEPLGGCATPTGCATRAGAEAVHALTFNLEYSSGLIMSVRHQSPISLSYCC